MRLSLLTGLLAVSAVLATTTRAERVIPTDLSGQLYLVQQRQIVSPTTPDFAMPTQDKSRIGPSFDCAKAVDPLSSLVCGNDQLAQINLGAAALTRPRPSVLLRVCAKQGKQSSCMLAKHQMVGAIVVDYTSATVSAVFTRSS